MLRWEVLKGLPGEGPIPYHFHTGHPTPWAEGLVVQLWNPDGTTWIGNFHADGSDRAQIVAWPEANAASVQP